MDIFSLKIGWVAIDIFVIMAITIQVECLIERIDKKFEHREAK